LLRPLMAPVLALTASLALSGCPLRPNPAYEPEDTGADTADVDADQETSNPCGDGELYCEGSCVEWDEPAHCGVCGRVCLVVSGCECSGDTLPQCAFRGGRACYAACAPDELLCGDECIVPPSDDHCGACGVVCDAASMCQCRAVEDGTAFECMRRVGDEWESC